MQRTEVLETLRGLLKLKVDIEKVIADVRNVNPDLPIGEERSKMIKDLEFGNDILHYGNMILNDDLWALYRELAQDMRD